MTSGFLHVVLGCGVHEEYEQHAASDVELASTESRPSSMFPELGADSWQL